MAWTCSNGNGRHHDEAYAQALAALAAVINDTTGAGMSNGTPREYLIRAFAGHDTINVDSGREVVQAGRGDDTVIGCEKALTSAS